MSSDYPASSSNENRFDSSSNNPTHAQFHQRRSPLNTIPDPSQLRQDLESDSDAPKLDGADGSHAFDDKTSVSSSEGLVAVKKYVSVGGLCTTTPKVTSRRARVNTESNSARSTPSTSCGSRGLGAGGKVYQSRASSTVSRRFTIVNTEQPEKAVDAPHFELEEHPFFWKDHNVQVLIRVRPLNNMERVMQGNARCLKQENAHALFWLGHPETRFTFDHIVCETITQEKLFRVAGLPMVENCMSGYNSCIFAYGQTGSGKTYTMMGEIHLNKGKLDQDCGITPRIFEFLFTKIKAEEERRTDEKLTYNCKCSFLEIYNEQITDLLEPSSNNLQLREDFKKGVYVENLTEHNVRTVNDVLQLLLKGSANRKNAATHMNSESSRSHSVFTCIIESRWEKDSMVHSRYGRLNLVDLAGSERQKSSGAEGDRLKEAANINKSLSTLGLVIMSLVDVAQGKQRHVPYRDSRLTFLLQDSLGGNSKTTIIANVSPSFCSASETLSSLKFAQRAKLIQNNAKVNEDASGDVTALQEQVQRLKEQLSNLLHIQGQPIEQSQKIDHSAIKKLEVRPENKRRLEDEAHHSTTKLLLEEGDSVTIRGDFGYDTYSNLAEDENGLEKNHYKANILIDASECEHVRLMEELQLTKERNKQLLDILETGSMKLVSEDSRNLELQYEVQKLNRELEEARLCNKQYEEAESLKLLRQKDVEIVCEQVEIETASTIIHLQEEIAMLQVELDKRSSSMKAENSNLQNAIRDKDGQLKEMSVQMIQWEKATLELTSFLMDGSKSMNIASSHIKSISHLFPCVNGSLRESIELAAQEFIKKEELILLLQKSLEEAQKTVFETEQHLNSLKRVAISFNEAQHQVSTGSSDELHKVVGKVCKDPETLSSELNRLSHTSSLEHEAQANELAMGEGKVLTDLTRLKRQKFDDITVNDGNASLGGIEHLKANDHQMMNCIREGIAETNSRLGLIQAFVSKLLETYADQWESDSSTSDSSMSLTNTSASEKRPCFVSASEPLHEVDGSMLIEELELASRGFRNLSVSLTSLVTQTDLTIKPHGYAVNNSLSGDASGNIIHRISDMSCLPQSSNPGTQGDHLDFNKSIPPDGKVEQSSGFISSFQEACATMQEADLMLNELVKSNVNANQLTLMWKQVGKNLKGERDCLFDQVQQLKSKLHASKAENTLENEISDLIRVKKSVASLLDFFKDMQKGLEELFTGVFSDILSMSKDVKSFVGSLRELFEQICAELMEKDFSSLVVCMCISDSLGSMQGLCVHREQVSHENEANSNAVSCGGTLSREQYDKIAALPMLEIEESYPHLGGLSQENLQLKRELQRKEVVLKGLLFDFSLLQEAASNRKDIKDEINKLIVALGQAEFELHVKRQDVNSLLLQIREMEGTLTATKQALAISNTELEKSQRSVGLLSNDNNELRILVDDLHSRKLVAEKQLDEQDEAIKGLEKEIIHLTSSASEKVLLSIENVEHERLRVTAERDQLRDEIRSLTEEVEMAYSLAEENEALALEAHQDSAANKIYAEQKEEEVKILESSIKELEDTVNVLEKKVQETDEEVQKHRLDRNSLETEIQALRQRMLTVEYLAENMDPEDTTNEKPDSHILRRFGNHGLDLDQACAQIKALKKIKAEQAKEISRMKEYISELVLFAEAQASQYQDKYKALEAMIRELKKKPTSAVSVAPVMERSEGSSSRSRGSSSPFRCISNLVHQMNVEKDHDLSTAKSRVEDLELLVASKQNEVCMLSSRLAAAESMTHDVIRDLLGLKLDMTNYADLVDENQLYSLLDVAQKKTMESERKEEEIHRLKMQMRDLINERDKCITEINRKESNVLAAQMTVEQLKERDNYLTVQNEMLKAEKSNLMNRLVEVESRANQQDYLGPVPSRRRR